MNPKTAMRSTEAVSGPNYHGLQQTSSLKNHSKTLLESRNEFFNQMRMKSRRKTSDGADSSTVVSPVVKNSDQLIKEMTENGSHLSDDAVLMYPNEEEEAFLRSLGWEEDSGGDSDEGGLTEEEINDFFQKVKIMIQSDHKKWRPASKLGRSLQLKIRTQLDPQASCELMRTTDSSL